MGWRATKAYVIWVGEQRRLRLACANAQSCQSLRFSHTQSMGDYEDRRVFRSLALLDVCISTEFSLLL